jgi:hypothetical protein
MITKFKPTVFATWSDARKAARKAQGPVKGFIVSSLDRSQYIPIVCGAVAGVRRGSARRLLSPCPFSASS